MFRKPLFIFYFLLLYALAELVWWGWLLVKAEPDRVGMIVGEGIVFLFLLLMGAYYLHKALGKEKAMHQQQKNFLLSVTHELKSPLASIKLYLQTILKRDLDKEKQRSFIESSLDDIERLDDLVENMLLATKIENRSYSFPKEMFSLSELVQSLYERNKKIIQDKRKFNARIAENIQYDGDRFALGSLVNNLVENAVKYSPLHSEVSISLEKINSKIILRVSDQGEGIAEQDKPKIFQKFYRACDENVRKTKGTGLGLFIVKQVADNHNADVLVKDNKPNGTIFEVIFNGRKEV